LALRDVVLVVSVSLMVGILRRVHDMTMTRTWSRLTLILHCPMPISTGSDDQCRRIGKCV
jgi:hypothetical protein